jgi:hypothetical protein
MFFFDTHDNKTKHDYYTSQEILEGTEQWIVEMMDTEHKHLTDRYIFTIVRVRTCYYTTITFLNLKNEKRKNRP